MQLEHFTDCPAESKHTPTGRIAQLAAEGVLSRLLRAQMVFAQRKRTEASKHFRRLCDKKINALAMAALLAVPDAAMPQEVSSGLGQLMAGLLKLLTTLKAQQVCLLSPCGNLWGACDPWSSSRTCLTCNLRLSCRNLHWLRQAWEDSASV